VQYVCLELGWASLALAGLVYHFYPAASITRLARFHFWLHNIGLPLFMVGLVLFVLTLGINYCAQKLVARYRMSIG